MAKARLARLLVAMAALLAPSVALAHPGTGGASGFLHGFSHPLSGLDHILAMVMVGALAWQIGGRAVWLVPASFVAAMTAGGAMAVAGLHLPLVEAGIALSVLVLGGLVAIGRGAPVALAMVLVGGFAVFHGYAHGAEMPESAGGLAYAAGFALATALLHAAGIASGVLLGRWTGRGSAVMRVAGGLAAMAGAFLVAGLA